MYEQVVQKVQSHASESAALTSAATAAVSWLPLITDIMQLIATVVAVLSGTLVLVLNTGKLRALLKRGKRNEGSTNFQSRTARGDND